MREGYAFIAFTDQGESLARRIAEQTGGEVSRPEGACSLAEWTAAAFQNRAGLIFVGAAGIAVRAVAPHIRSKAEDPAVVVLDEQGRFVIPLLSGHLGGANALAREIAGITEGTPVITTATDLHGLFAVDLWAGRQGMHVLQPGRIKNVSGKLLQGGEISVGCRWPVSGTLPEHVRLGSPPDVLVDYRRSAANALQLVPGILVLGLGCRKGTPAKTLEEVFARFCDRRGVLPQAIRAAASVDLKAREEGLLHFCADHGWPVRFYSAEDLQRLEGDFSASPFVKETVGADNVCERAAVLDSGGILAEKKYAEDGVTFALAERNADFDWSW